MEEEEEGYLFIVSPARGGSLLSGRLGTTPSPTEGSSRSKKTGRRTSFSRARGAPQIVWDRSA